MAWRETRRQRRKLLLYTSAIILGVAALVSVQSISENLSFVVLDKSKELLGADVRLQSRQPIESDIDSLFLGNILAQSQQVQFMSMVSNAETKATRLASINAVDSLFPLYGDLELVSGAQTPNFFSQDEVLLDAAIPIQLKLDLNDSIKIGSQKYRIAGILKRLPGESFSSLIGPRIIIPKNTLSKTGLMQRGSIVNYSRYYKLQRDVDTDKIIADNRRFFRDNRIRSTTLKSQQETIQKAFDGLYKFLSLVGYISLILGGIGISSSIFVFLKGKIRTIAIMKSLGASSAEILGIYSIQASILGLLGSALGVCLGVIIQYALPSLLSDFININFQARPSLSAIYQGFTIGVLTTICFTLLPILSLKLISPLQALREASNALKTNKRTQLFFSLFVSIFVLSLTYFQLGELKIAAAFTVFIAVAFTILFLAASLLIFVVKKSYKRIPHFLLRHAAASLFRPNNQTRTMIISIGLGISMIGLLYFVQDSLLESVRIGGEAGKPNMVLIDIQSDQLASVKTALSKFQVSGVEMLPIVPMKITYIKDTPTDSINLDSTSRSVRFAVTGTLRSTFRKKLSDSETLVSGVFPETTQSFNDSIFISMEDRFAKNLELELGDRVDFNVQGLPITTYVGSLREVDWKRTEPNFMIVFPDGILNDAPHTYVSVLRSETKEESIKIQRELVASFPNISVVDLSVMISAIEELLEKISLIIEFMALFSIITGFIIVAGGIISSRYQRMQEHVILRTLGAVKSHLRFLLLAEYSLLGLLAAVLGLGLAFGAGELICYFWFKIEFVPSLSTVGALIAFTLITTIVIGLLNSRGTTTQSPLEVLRRDAT